MDGLKPTMSIEPVDAGMDSLKPTMSMEPVDPRTASPGSKTAGRTRSEDALGHLGTKASCHSEWRGSTPN